MTNIIFSFDTEDYVNPYGADGILGTSAVLREAGFRGCYNVVGLMAEALVEWGRQDAIDEIRKYHEVDYHSHRHSLHPSINEYTDRADFYAALEDFKADESVGLKKVCDIFGVDAETMPSACPPGNSTSYVAHYGYADMGFPIYTGDDLIDTVRSRPIYVCNVATTHYITALENKLFTATEESLKKYLDDKVAKRDLFIFFNHPQRVTCTTYCDIDNFYGVNTPKDKWIPSPPHTDEEIAKFYENFRILVRLIKEDPRFNVITYKELREMLKEDDRIIDAATLKEIKKQLDEEFFPVTTPNSFCLSDVMLAARALLLGESEHKCGYVYGFLDTPYTVPEPVTLTKAEIIEAAKRIRPDRFLPEYIVANDKKIGPADWLRAALAVLVDGAEEYTVMPDGQWQIDLDQFPTLRDLKYDDSWVHCRSLSDKYLSDRFRLQTWTIRLQKGTDRKIF